MTRGPSESRHCITVAVFAPVRSEFDYLPPEDVKDFKCHIGQRVWVPFGRSFRVGVVVATDVSAARLVRLKHIIEFLDPISFLSAEVIELAQWACKYYHYPIGETLAHIFPSSLRKRKKVVIEKPVEWSVTEEGASLLADGKLKGIRQIDLLTRLSSVGSMNDEDFKVAELGYHWRPIVKKLTERGFVTRRIISDSKNRASTVVANKVTLNSAQIEARDIILDQIGGYKTVLLYGVTGGGKTEVYMDVIENVLMQNKQSLVLVPEITLTEQIVARFRRRFGDLVGVLHSQCKESEKISVWNGCRSCTVKILIGTRSAIWTPMSNLGLIVVDEEHDASYKQQDGLPYSGRDIAIKRGQIEKVPVVLGSATPSLETLANVSKGRYEKATIESRAKVTANPFHEIVDISQDKIDGGLSQRLRDEIEIHVSRGDQVLLFLNRRGYAPLVMCRSCGAHQICEICERHLVYHKLEKSLVCHHCGRRRRISSVSKCCQQQNLFDLGLGTEQIEEKVRHLFPKFKISRIDRDNVKSTDEVRKIFRKISDREVDILIGTQMIAKGLDFSGITLVGIIDTDNRLYSTDYRSEERLAQLLTQVAGRCGRDSKGGKVLVQSQQPDNPILKKIVYRGYDSYASAALKERRRMGMPPFAALAVVKADSNDKDRPLRFLEALRASLACNIKECEMFISYPIQSLERRKRRQYRSLIVMQCQRRKVMQKVLSDNLMVIENLGRKFGVRWLLEVDPEDTM